MVAYMMDLLRFSSFEEKTPLTVWNLPQAGQAVCDRCHVKADFWRPPPHARRQPRNVVYEVPLLSVLDEHGVDHLLRKLLAVHGEPRFDLASELVSVEDCSLECTDQLCRLYPFLPQFIDGSFKFSNIKRAVGHLTRCCLAEIHHAVGDGVDVVVFPTSKFSRRLLPPMESTTFF
jgi:hypothetical protein